MSHPSSPPTPLAAASPAPASPVSWPDAARQAAFEQWLAPLVQSHQLLPASLRPASADASFRRYLRIDSAAGASCIVMDAPPDKENCRPFVQVQALMAAAGLNVPHILAWDEPGGFMLLSDLGSTTLIELLTPEAPQAALGWYLQATDVLLDWQKASKPGVLPAYDEALLRRELDLFPDWYLGKHLGIELVPEQPYTSQDLDYNDESCRANQEQKDPAARPRIAGQPLDLSQYGTIYLGYPIWQGTAPRIINTFLDSYDLTGKTIRPFCTSGSSGIETSVADIRAAAPEVNVTAGLHIADPDGSDVKAWALG